MPLQIPRMGSAGSMSNMPPVTTRPSIAPKVLVGNVAERQNEGEPPDTASA